MCDTPSHGSDHLWLIWKESIQNCRCYRADTAGGTDGRMDRWTDGRTDGRSETNIPPQQLRCSGGINITPHKYCITIVPVISISWKFLKLHIFYLIQTIRIQCFSGHNFCPSWCWDLNIPRKLPRKFNTMKERELLWYLWFQRHPTISPIFHAVLCYKIWLPAPI